jgi:hypothetical protein
MTRTQVRAASALVVAALLVGPSAQARAPHAPDQDARPAYGHTTNEWLMMGPACGSSMTPS